MRRLVKAVLIAAVGGFCCALAWWLSGRPLHHYQTVQNVQTY